MTPLAPATRPRRILAAVAACAALAALAFGGTPAAGQTVADGRSAPGSAAAVPWSQVGPGWFLALVDLQATNVQPETAPTVLYLVSPTGRRYDLRHWLPGGPIYPPRTIAAWSPSGRFALLPRLTVRGRSLVTEVDLTTGAQHDIWLPAGTEHATAAYTRPSGANIVVYRASVNAGAVLERRSRSGAVLSTLWRWSGEPGVSWVYARDGRSLVVGTDSRIRPAFVITNHGRLIRRLDARPGGCRPVKWWTSTAVLAACVTPRTSYYHRLWVLPVGGGAAHPLTAAPAKVPSVVDFGFWDAWRTSTHTFVQWRGDCGAAGIRRLTTLGHSTRVQIPGSAGANEAVAVGSARLGVYSHQSCGETGGWLGWYYPASATRTVLLRSPAGTYGITDVRRFNSP